MGTQSPGIARKSPRDFAMPFWLAGFVDEAGLPVARVFAELDDSDLAWKRLFGVRRAKTLRNRYHAWKRFREYLLATRGIPWPTKAGDL